MKKYIGLDAHAASTTLAVVGSSGKRGKEFVVKTSEEQLKTAIKGIRGERWLCIEEGELSSWLYEILSPYVDHCIVAQPQPRPRQGSKSDKIDAYTWAERLRTDTIQTPVFKAPQKFTTLRQLAAVYRMNNCDLVRVKNRLKSFYRSRGVCVIGKQIYTEEAEVWLKKLPASAQLAAELLHQRLKDCIAHKQEAEKKMVQVAKSHSAWRFVRSVPGLGDIRVSQLLPIVVTPHRFHSTRAFWAYCGLAVVSHSSSDWVQLPNKQWIRANTNKTRGLNRNHHRVLKDVFKGAANTIILCKNSNGPLFQSYVRLTAAGTKPNLAKLTIARKIASITLAVWKQETIYDTKKHQACIKL